jgi:hypothetical protein
VTRVSSLVTGALAMLALVNYTSVYGMLGWIFVLLVLAACAIVQIPLSGANYIMDQEGLLPARASGANVVAPMWAGIAAWPVLELVVVVACSLLVLQVVPWSWPRSRRIVELASVGALSAVAVVGVVGDLEPWPMPEPMWLDGAYLATCVALVLVVVLDHPRQASER